MYVCLFSCSYSSVFLHHFVRKIHEASWDWIVLKSFSYPMSNPVRHTNLLVSSHHLLVASGSGQFPGWLKNSDLALLMYHPTTRDVCPLHVDLRVFFFCSWPAATVTCGSFVDTGVLRRKEGMYSMVLPFNTFHSPRSRITGSWIGDAKGQPERHQAEESADTKCRNGTCGFSSGSRMSFFSKGKGDCPVVLKHMMIHDPSKKTNNDKLRQGLHWFYE